MGSRKEVPREKASPGWFSYSGHSTTVVFVHGVLSDQDSAWRGAAFWPDLLKTDARLPLVNIYLATYHTSFSSGIYKISDCASELLDALSFPVDERGSVMDFEEIVFVCHSMGGIVVRSMLSENFHLFAAKKIGLVLMASPSMGSRWANWISPFARLLGHEQALALRMDSTESRDLDERFRQVLHQRRIPRLIGVEAQEHLGIVKSTLGKILIGRIVVSDSGSRYFGAPRLLPGTTHLTIVKPDNHDAVGHKFLVRFLLQDFEVKVDHKSSINKNGGSVSELPVEKDISKVLFDSLDRESLSYYLRRDDDDIISDSMAQFSVWLVGPSGVGKTSAARAQILSTGNPVLELCLSAYAGRMSVEVCLDELAYVLERRGGLPYGTLQRAEQSIFREVARLAENESLILYFDEVPLSGESDSAVDAFTAFVVRLLNFVKDQSHCPGFRILLSSVGSPGKRTSLDGKVRERLKVIDLSLWSESSLQALLHLVLPPLRSFSPGFEPDETRLVFDSLGLPRELKNSLRELLVRERGAVKSDLVSSAGEG